MTQLVIKAIRRNTLPGTYNLVVLDNGSDSETTDRLIKLQDNDYIDNLILLPENKGLEFARDKLLEDCDSEYMVCLDNDCVPPPMSDKGAGLDWLTNLTDLMNKYESFGAIAARTQVMIGTGNIFDGKESEEIVQFGHPGGSFRIMRSKAVKEVGGWDSHSPGRGSEERLICGKLRQAGWETGFATKVKCLHLFGNRSANTDRWGYPSDWVPSQTGHSDIWHPVLENGDNFEEVMGYCGKRLTKEYFGGNCINIKK
jgi:glycosyltransferase involved in cell wall biosynthesis